MCRVLHAPVWFLLVLMVLIPFNLYLALAPAKWWPWLWGVMQIRPHPSFLFSLALVELVMANFLIAHLLEVRDLPLSVVGGERCVCSLSCRDMCCRVSG